jgi:hypothetical protein
VANWHQIFVYKTRALHSKQSSTELQVWRKASEKWRPECLGYIANVSSANIKIIVWSCLTYYGVGTLAFIDGNMNSQTYIQTLDDNIWPVVTKHFGNNT